MKISIITVTYNCVDTLEKTIKSVLQQKYDDIEYIIIDGASTDGTRDIILKYASNIDYWVSEPDDGLYYAMNKGVDAATGDYVYFLNSGDVFAGNVLGYVAHCMKLHDADVIYGDNYEGKNGIYHLERSQIECVDWKMNICHQSIFMKNKGIHFDTKYRIAADYELLNKLYNRGATFQYIPKAIVYFESGGLSSQWNKGRMEFAEIACLAQIKYGKCSPVAIDIMVHNFIDTINRNKYLSGENTDLVIDFVKQNYGNKDALIWGRGAVAKALVPAIARAGVNIKKVIDNNTDKASSFNGISVCTPESLVDEKNINVFILTDRYCDEIYAQLKYLNPDETVQAIRFSTANDEYLDIHHDELIEYAINKYAFFNDMCKKHSKGLIGME